MLQELALDDDPRLIGRFWHFPDGTILPLVSGGADDDGDGGGADDDAGAGADGDNVDGDDGSGDDGDGDKPLGPAGEKALNAEKEKRRTAQAALREWKALGKSPAEIKALLDAQTGGDQPDVDTIRQEARAEADAALLESRVMDKIEAKAARLFADPDDAAALLMRDHGADEFLDDGKIDVEAIQDALKELLDKKPYLAAQGKRFQGDADGGTRNGSGPKQLTRADLAGMSPQEIEKARREGRLVNLLTGKTA